MEGGRVSRVKCSRRGKMEEARWKEGGRVSRINSVRGEERWKREDGRREGK